MTLSKSEKNKSEKSRSTKRKSAKSTRESGEKKKPNQKQKPKNKREKAVRSIDINPTISTVSELAPLNLTAGETAATLPLTQIDTERLQLAASFWRRFFAFLLDLLFLLTFSTVGLGAALAYSIFMFSEPITDSKQFSISDIENILFLTLTLIIVLSWLYLTALDSMKPWATLGKLIFGISLVHENGRSLSWLRSNLRLLAAGLSILTLGLGFVAALFRKDRRMLHDLVSKSVAVHTTNQWGSPQR